VDSIRLQRPIRTPGNLVLVALGAFAVVLGVTFPAYWRAVEPGVLEQIGRGSTTLAERSAELLKAGELGRAALLAQVATRTGCAEAPNAETAAAIRGNPAGLRWGPSPVLRDIFPSTGDTTAQAAEPVAEFLIRRTNRTHALDALRTKGGPDVSALLKCLTLTNTVILPPSASASGQAIDAAVALSGLLALDQRLTPAFSQSFRRSADVAVAAGDTRPLEFNLLNLLSLGQRLTFDQLAGLLAKVGSAETVQAFADAARSSPDAACDLAAAVELTGDPGVVGRFIDAQGARGVRDIGACLRFNAEAVRDLVAGGRRLYRSPFHPDPHGAAFANTLFQWAVVAAWRAGSLAAVAKWLLCLGGSMLLIVGWLDGRGLQSTAPTATARELLFAASLTLALILVTEPHLSSGSEPSLHRPILSFAAATTAAPVAAKAAFTLMNQTSNVLTLLLFFALQGGIYAACLLKLAEVTRQPVAARVRLRLLENEEHLFDAGLYLGFLGTIVSLILVSVGVIKFSLMAAYSSTSFGIVFVSIFKIFQLRPARRRLLIEAETDADRIVGAASVVSHSAPVASAGAHAP
jgi:hypothetical protein